MTPISYGLRTTSGYTARLLKEPVTHLMFVDDLKIYASGGAAMGRSLKEVERITNSIGMKIGASKCATASIRRGKVTRAADHSFGNALIKALSVGKSYKYLGITQVFRAEEREVRESLRKVYFDRLNRIWKAPLSARNKIHASNVWAISLFRYFFSSPMKWTKTYLKQLDTATRRILRKHKGHYRGASVERLYLKGDMGGRGLHNLTHVYQREVVSAVAYLMASDDPYHTAVVEHMKWKSERHRSSLFS